MAWICEVCHKPIKSGAGYVEIHRKRTLVTFSVLHRKCDPHSESNSYWFRVESASTLAKWCSWVVHLSEKTWMSKDDIGRMIEFWFKNRGEVNFRRLG